MSIIAQKSLAFVAMNKDPSSDVIECCPFELLSIIDGELAPETSTVKSTGIDRENNVYKVELEMGHTIKAHWWGETNRVTPPDVRRGESVNIWCVGDSKRYYWESTGRDDKLRRLETVLYRYSGLPTNDDEEISDDNSYFFEVSTHKKTVTLKTSMRNGERAGYTMQFNTGAGQYTVEDNEGNIIQLDTANTHIYLENSTGSIVELNKKDIRAWNPGNCEVWMVGKDILMHNGNGVKFELIGRDTISTSPGNHIVNATNHIVNAKTLHNKPVIGGKATYGKINVGAVNAGKINVGILVAGKFNYPKP